MKYAYYPGCTMHGTAREYGESTDAVFDRLNLELVEIDDWNCCGATALASTRRVSSYAVPLRNLAIAEQMGMDVAVACSACFMVLNRAREVSMAGTELSDKVNEALAVTGREFAGRIKVRHTLDIVYNDVGVDDIARLAENALEGMSAVPYYGCQIARPKNEAFATEFPTELDEIMAAVGLTVPQFDRKTKCCGAALMTTKADAALKLNEEILKEAVDKQADFIVTTCPMCQMNTEAYQNKINKRFGTNYKIPVLYFTQVIGLALGMDAKMLGLHRHMVPTKQLIRTRKVGVES